MTNTNDAAAEAAAELSIARARAAALPGDRMYDHARDVANVAQIVGALEGVSLSGPRDGRYEVRLSHIDNVARQVDVNGKPPRVVVEDLIRSVEKLRADYGWTEGTGDNCSICGRGSAPSLGFYADGNGRVFCGEHKPKECEPIPAKRAEIPRKEWRLGADKPDEIAWSAGKLRRVGEVPSAGNGCVLRLRSFVEDGDPRTSVVAVGADGLELHVEDVVDVEWEHKLGGHPRARIHVLGAQAEDVIAGVVSGGRARMVDDAAVTKLANFEERLANARSTADAFAAACDRRHVALSNRVDELAKLVAANEGEENAAQRFRRERVMRLPGRMPGFLIVDAGCPTAVAYLADVVVDLATKRTTKHKAQPFPDEAAPVYVEAATAWAARFGRDPSAEPGRAPYVSAGYTPSNPTRGETISALYSLAARFGVSTNQGPQDVELALAAKFGSLPRTADVIVRDTKENDRKQLAEALGANASTWSELLADVRTLKSTSVERAGGDIIAEAIGQADRRNEEALDDIRKATRAGENESTVRAVHRFTGAMDRIARVLRSPENAITTPHEIANRVAALVERADKSADGYAEGARLAATALDVFDRIAKALGVTYSEPRELVFASKPAAALTRSARRRSPKSRRSIWRTPSAANACRWTASATR